MRRPRRADAAEVATPAAAVMLLAVPAISSFFGITIAMYYDDHGHPHFHARHAGEQAKVRIDELDVIESTLGRR